MGCGCKERREAMKKKAAELQAKALARLQAVYNAQKPKGPKDGR